MTPLLSRITRFDLIVFCAAVLLGMSLANDGFIIRPLALTFGYSGTLLETLEATALVFCLCHTSRFALAFWLTRKRAALGQPPLPKLFFDLLAFGIYFLGTVALFVFVLEKDVTAVLATGGFGVMLLGIALRDLMLAAFTGVLLNSEKPFKVGDMISVNGGSPGVVKNMSWRTTTLDSPTGMVVIPNLQLANAVITNFVKPDGSTRRILTFTLDYEIPVDTVENVVVTAIVSNPRIRLTAPPVVLARQIDKDGVNYEVRYNLADYRDAFPSEHQAIRSILEAFTRLGITISYPKYEFFETTDKGTFGTWRIDLQGLLRRNPWFAGLDDGDVNQLVRHLRPLRLAPGECLTVAGRQVKSAYILGEGQVCQVLGVSQDGREQVRWLAPGELIAAECLLYGMEESLTLRARSTVTAFALDAQALATLTSTAPGLAGKLSAALARAVNPAAEQPSKQPA